MSLLDPDDIARSGCKSLFEADGRFHLTGEAPDADDVLSFDGGGASEVVVLNPVLGGVANAVQVGRVLTACPSARILVLTDSTDVSFHAETLRAGVAALFLKGHVPGWLLLNIAEMIGRSNATFVDGDVLTRMKLSGAVWESLEGGLVLSPRETEVARLLTEGMSDDEIAHALRIARATVHTHVSSIMRKAPATNRVQLGIYLAHSGLVDPECMSAASV